MLRERPKSSQAAHALATLYDTHGASAFSLAFAMLADREAAEGAVQQAFWRLQDKAESNPDVEIGCRALLLHHVFRAAVNDARQPAQRDGVPGLVDALPDDEREALLLCLHGVGYAELAAIQRVETRTIAARLRQAVSSVRVPASATHSRSTSVLS